MPPDEIEPLVTERLVLRLVEGSDEAAIHSYRSNPAATRYLSHEPLSVEANRERLKELLVLAEASAGAWFNYCWAITLRQSGEVIGDARTWNSTAVSGPGMLAPGRHPAGHAALAYVLHPDYQHHGYGREAAAALVTWLFAQRRIKIIAATVYEPNRPSIQLLRSLGFQPDAVPPEYQESAGKGLPLLMFRLESPDSSP
ncbi:ribosomal-protein-alanine N-acetyltransferase [Pseudarthrobacter sp. W1I19]|uniref:GNAT family N-acetyltransferase n=1 Tax=Pseudarthrobacter sp. W1I19 TaxID=3042288 RepID=UPI002785D54F|nr:GNAT family N-acetyltransferase [Pseudarthrobacter sp. W1I19]MDQ0925030.1 ribosomal-protein-alanine N-acetyltransferase [Pseudarthrobacter sp. W1I19]